MKEIALEDLLKKVESLFELSNLAARRAMELNSGMKKLVVSHPNEKVTTVAIREIADGKVKLKKTG
ncbi:MAG: DNA-directed RNA polymerase subunit omega [Candidatus Omnitrophica bacterium]|nr:DNA-directed RNA polymerase subunit omega [Candidatus Omnitrophota bacterium]